MMKAVWRLYFLKSSVVGVLLILLRVRWTWVTWFWGRVKLMPSAESFCSLLVRVLQEIYATTWCNLRQVVWIVKILLQSFNRYTLCHTCWLVWMLGALEQLILFEFALVPSLLRSGRINVKLLNVLRFIHHILFWQYKSWIWCWSDVLGCQGLIFWQR